MMDQQVPVRVVFVGLFLLFLTASSEEEQVKQALVQFMGKLSPRNMVRDPSFGWNVTSDPCTNKWHGVTCDSRSQFVRKIVLDQFNLTGVLDATSLCKATSLFVLSLNDNNVGGEIPQEISNCRFLTHVYLSGNRFSGNLPVNLSRLNNLKRLDVSNNVFSGQVPDLSRISGLLSFLAQNNLLSGEIPKFDFSNLEKFNVSNNKFSGPIPDVAGRFNASSFSGNPELCGQPLSNGCPTPPPPRNESKRSSKNQFLIYSGFFVVGLIVVLFIAVKIFLKKKASKDKKKDNEKKAVEVDSRSDKISGTSSEYKNRSEYSISSAESRKASNSLVVLSGATISGLKFEDLLQAPAELVGRGKNGSLYKVLMNGGETLAVKRIKDWGMTRADFEKRMQRIDQVKHPNVMPVVAYYCSKQEKLLVYEFQQNGSLFKLLHGSQNGQLFDWGNRLSVAASIALTLAFMHEELHQDGIAHGNLKSSNILLNKDMDPYISEYGLMVIDTCQEQSILSQTDSFKSNDPSGGRAYSTFKVDIYGFGVILLELLTGKLVQNSGFDLARCVHSMVKEEWTVEVFDKALISEGANEERMVNLLQVALKCINPSPDARPNINQVAIMINSIKDEEEKSLCSDT